MKYTKALFVTAIVTSLTYVLGVVIIRSVLKETSTISELAESTRRVFDTSSMGFVVMILSVATLTFLSKYLDNKNIYWVLISVSILLGAVLTFMGN